MSSPSPKPSAQKRKADDELQRPIRRKAAEAPKLGRRTIKVKVGEGAEPATFNIHEELVAQHSDFFKAAIDGKWKEGQERCVMLPEDKPEIFEIFYHFVYEGQLFTSKDGDAATPGKDFEWVRLSSSWVLGDKLLSSSFKDAILDCVVSKIVETKHYPLEFYPPVYEKSVAESPARKLMVDIAVNKWSTAEFKKVLIATPCNEFAVDIVAEMNDRMTDRRRFEEFTLGICKYHEHDIHSKPCYKTLF